METLSLGFVTDFFPPHVGGVPVHQWEIATRLARRGHQVHVLTCRLPGTPRSEVADGVEVTRVGPSHRISRLGFAGRAVPQATKLARKMDALQASTFVGAGPASLARTLTGTPCLLTVHELFLDDWPRFLPGQLGKAKLLQAAEAALLRLPYDAVATPSRYTQERLRRFGWGPGRSVVIPNGVDTRFWDPSIADPEGFRHAHGLSSQFLFLYFGRAGISKGVDVLLDAAEMALPTMPDARLVVILGPGELQRYIHDRIKKSRVLASQVLVLASVERPVLRDAVAAADAVVLPSLSEGFGLAHAEACAMGRPIIATNVGPLPDVVGGRRQLVPPGDPIALAKALRDAQEGQWEAVQRIVWDWDDTARGYEVRLGQLRDG